MPFEPRDVIVERLYREQVRAACETGRHVRWGGHCPHVAPETPDVRPGGWLRRVADRDLPPVAHGARAFVR